MATCEKDLEKIRKKFYARSQGRTKKKERETFRYVSPRYNRVKRLCSRRSTYFICEYQRIRDDNVEMSISSYIAKSEPCYWKNSSHKLTLDYHY